MRNIFLEKSYTKCVGETRPTPVSEKLKLSISLDSLKFDTVCFYCMVSWGLSKYIETKLQTTLFLPHIKIFWKIKKSSETSLLALFSV